MSSGLALIPQSYYYEFQQRGLNVIDYGADPTNTNDSTTAIQNAINSLVGKGGTVYFPPGNYKLSSTLTIPQGWPILLKGSGIDSTVIHYGGTADAISMPGASGNMIEKSGIQDLRLTGNASAQNGLNITYGYAMIFRNMQVDAFFNGLLATESWDWTFDSARFISNTDGVHLGAQTNNFTFIACEFNSNSGHGLFIDGSRSLDIISSDIETNGYGVYITCDTNGTSQGINIRGCYIEGNTTEDILLNRESGTASPTGVTVDGNYFVCMTGKATVAIRVNYANGLKVENNDFSVGTATYGYSTYISDNATVSQVVTGTANVDTSTNGIYHGANTAYTDEARLMPKAWGRFTVSGGAVSLSKSFNVASVTYTAAGTYQVTLQSAMKDTTYGIVASAENGATYSGLICSPAQPASTTQFTIYTASASNALAEARTVSFAVFD